MTTFHINERMNWYKVLILASLVVLCSCSNENQINHCVYGVTEDVFKLEAKICGAETVPYKKVGDHWETTKTIITSCESDIALSFFFDTGEVITDYPLYVSWPASEFTRFDKYFIETPNDLYRQKAGRGKLDAKCLPENKVEFTVEVSRY